MGLGATKPYDPREYLQNLIDRDIIVNALVEPIYEPDEQVKEQLMKLLSESYYGDDKHCPERAMQWVHAKYYQEDDDQKRLEKLKQDYEFLGKWVITFTLKYGLLYAVKGFESKEYAGVACIFPSNSMQDGKLFTIARIYQTFKACGFPPCHKEENQKNQQKLEHKRCEAYMTQFCKTFSQNPNSWFLHSLAIKPQFQGQGYGKILLQLFNSLADAQNYPSVLACTGENMIVYFEKMGYKVQEQYHFEVKNLPSSQCAYQTAIMQRQPQSIRIIQKLIDIEMF